MGYNETNLIVHLSSNPIRADPYGRLIPGVGAAGWKVHPLLITKVFGFYTVSFFTLLINLHIKKLSLKVQPIIIIHFTDYLFYIKILLFYIIGTARLRT